jgi:hypothetical protein
LIGGRFFQRDRLDESRNLNLIADRYGYRLWIEETDLVESFDAIRR